MDPLPPGPSTPAALQTAHWLIAPIEFMESCARRHGDSFTVRFLGFERPMVMLADPAAIRSLYAQEEQRLPPARALALRAIMGARSLLLLEGAEHLARRRLMLPAFHGERMRAYEAMVAAIAEREIARWPLGAEIALHPRARALTLEVIMRVVFGVSDPGRLARLRELLPALLDGASSLALGMRVLLAASRGRRSPFAAFEAQIAQLDGLLLEDIAARRDGPRGDDVLSLLLDARFEDGAPMSDRELRDQLVTLLLAGHETTATALAWTVDLLAHEPAALARAQAEVRDGAGDRYLRAVVAESLRLRPVVPMAARRLAAELRCDGFTLPAGTDVTPAIWLTHTRADLYPQPHAFRPERFLESTPPSYAWIPFGGGVRRCLGASFAELELRLVLRCLLERFELRSRRPRERMQRRNITIVPRRGTRVRLTPRAYTASVGSRRRSASVASTRGSAAAVRRQDPAAP